MFNEYVKDLRIKKRLTLREFCNQIGVDPSNWSKVERGINPPPSSIEFLDDLANFFELSEEERVDLQDKASLSRSEIPKDLEKNKSVLNALPAFFRSARQGNLDDNQIKQLISEIEKLNRPDFDNINDIA